MESNLRNENLTIGMELNRTDGVGDPVEGSNVNLMCRTYVYTASFSPPKWSYQINGNGQMRIIDETNPFEGLKFPLVRVVVSSLFKVIFSILNYRY